MKQLIVGSDFSGVGAFDQALERLGLKYKTAFACDQDKYARQTYTENYGEPEYFPDNVYNRDIPKESLDIYMSSPPCQAFSMSGLRLGKEDKRGILFFNSLEFIKKNKPRYAIFENVRGLVSHDKGNTFKEWLDLLGGKSVNGVMTMCPSEDSVPYHIHWEVINAKHHGVPQNRERVFIVCIRDDQDNNFEFPEKETLNKKLRDILQDQVDEKHYLSDKMLEKITYKVKLNEDKKVAEVANLNKGGQKGPVYSYYTDYMSCLTATDYKQPKQIMLPIKSATKRGFELAKEGDSINFTHPNSKTRRGRVGKEVAQTLDTACSQATYIFGKVRRLTPTECFRLMDFKDDFKWSCSDTQAYKQAGNSIVVRVLEKIINNLNL